MKSIQIDHDLYDYLASKATEAGEAPSQILRRELHLPQQQETIEIDDDTYAYLVSKATALGESASDILRRELNTGGAPDTPPPGPDPGQPQPIPGVVEFHIPSGTQAKAWNTQQTTMMAHVGDTLRIFNDDAVPHRLHTNNAPFPHPANDIAPMTSADFTLISAYDSAANGPLYDHDMGMAAQFWITVTSQ